MADDERTAPQRVERVADTWLPTDHGTFRMTAYRDDRGTDHVALSQGVSDDDGPDADPPLVRIHSECLTGDALGSRRCDCGEQLQASLHLLGRTGRGVVIYVRDHEGRAIGLGEKLRAYALQDRGADTVDANLALGHPADARTYAHCAAMLLDLGVDRVRLLSSNPAKQIALRALGIQVSERIPIVVPHRDENAAYLATKRTRMGHDRTAPPEWEELLAGRVPATGVLAQRYGDLAQGEGPLVVAQLGQSLDGFIATRTGDATFVTGELDREHLHRLRALVDAVVVGGATVACDDPRLTVRAVTGRHPTRVVLDPRGVTPRTASVLTDGAAPTLWVVGPEVEAGAPGDHVDVVRWPTDGPMDPRAVVDLLAARDLRRVLVEGGGRLVSAFVRAEVVHRLYLTTAPVLIGDGVPGLRVEGQDRLTDALRPPARRYQLGEDVVTELELTPRPATCSTLAADVPDAS
ncbi:GTP cyclohydrolase II [Serinicoccus kebangsaanensis]|uniref:GTP cyclohydrolase II n=1 Tax=Serinicoccus kebangsaanensis TaxID=2602069 RepID=UPI001EE330B8|nr:GTP cyclohydrolase II [Serinicoccus kebangsaanensis]